MTKKTHAILVDTKEAKVLYEALCHAVDPEKANIGKALNKRSNAYKLADEISNLLPIW